MKKITVYAYTNKISIKKAIRKALNIKKINFFLNYEIIKQELKKHSESIIFKNDTQIIILKQN